MLKRTSIKFINNSIKENPKWKILDIGCGYRAHPSATIIADKQDLSSFIMKKNFVQINEKKLPFKDKEFDFVIASHVIEHVEDLNFFIHELERISSKGYIELPTRLGDNLVFENKTDHIWWFVYDDIKNKLIASKKNQILEPFITVSTARLLEGIFRESLVTEVYWEQEINYELNNSIHQMEVKNISFLKIIKKYFSKKFRTLYKKKS